MRLRLAGFAVLGLLFLLLPAAGCTLLGNPQLTVADTGMQPALKKGSRVIYDPSAYREGSPEQRDLVVYEFKGELRVARVIGLQFQKLEIRQGVVYINDEPLPEQYVERAPKTHFGEITVPEGQVFLLGDNRAKAKDSRDFGPLPLAQLRGKVVSRINAATGKSEPLD